MRILLLAPRYPHPATRGDQRRVLELLRVLRSRADVTLLTFGEGPELPFDGVDVQSHRPRLAGRLAENLRHPDPRVPAQVRLYLDRGFRRAVECELTRLRPDVVHITLSRLASYLPPPGPWHRHLDLVDSLSVNLSTRAAFETRLRAAVLGAEARLVARWEACAVRAADSASLVAEGDRVRAPGLRGVAIVPNGVDASAFPFADPAAHRDPLLLFFGNLGYFHALEPARFLAEDVLPLVRRSVPGARVRIVGARPPASVTRLGELPGVEVTGPVEDMAAALHSGAAAVLPAFSGSGMKNKVLEAFCAGLPVVANAEGMHGIEGALSGVDHLVAEGAQGTADACVELLSDPVRRGEMARAARALVESRFSWDRRAQQLLRLYAGQA